MILPLSSNSRYKSKSDADEAVSVVSLTSSSGGYINGRNSANLALLIDKTSSIYLYMKLKASWIFLSFTAFEETPTHMSIKINLKIKIKGNLHFVWYNPILKHMKYWKRRVETYEMYKIVRTLQLPVNVNSCVGC